MSRPDLKQAKAAFDRVRAILHGEWDPIGAGVPLDEYDSYAWPVLAAAAASGPNAPRSKPISAGRPTKR